MSMPIESLPGLSLTSFGFIVERYMIFFLGVAGAVVVAATSGWPPSIGTSRIPQIGQSPGLSDTTLGCIGQWYFGNW
jgi:hypothetical protein